jgi:hypothetical protein
VWDATVAAARNATLALEKHACLFTSSLEWWIRHPPAWGLALLNASALGVRDVKDWHSLLGRATIFEPVQRMCRGAEDQASTSSGQQRDNDVGVITSGYSVSRAEKKELFRKVDPRRLDLPEVGRSLLRPEDFLGFPFEYIFSEGGIAFCLVEVTEPDKGHTSCNLADGVTQRDLIAKLDLHGLLYFLREYVNERRGGLFSLNKTKAVLPDGTERHRIVHDAVNPNKEICMVKLQRLYEMCCAMNPVRAALMGCGSKVMNIASPADLCDLPSGAACSANTDYKCFFYQFRQLRHLWRLQGLFNVNGEDYGLGPGRFRCGLKTLSMGGKLSALIGHGANWTMLSRAMARKPMRAVVLEKATALHRADFAEVVRLGALGADGRVPWFDVPARLRENLVAWLPGGEGGGSAKLQGMRAPPAMFAFELTDRVRHLDRADWIEVETVMVGGDRTGRAGILRVLAQNGCGDGVEHWCVGCMPYLDDNNNLTYPPVPASDVASVNRACSVGGLHLILTVLAADVAGLVQHMGKMLWPTRQNSVTLGITLEFLDEGRLRCAVAGFKRFRLRRELMHLVSLFAHGRAKLIDEQYLRELLGQLNWNFLVRRALLSTIGVPYRALGSPNRPAGKVNASNPMTNEVWVAAGLLAFAESTSAPFSNTLWTYDASGVSRVGNGGYGVAYRHGLTEEIAVELTTPVRGTGLSYFKVQPDGSAPLDRLELLRHAGAAKRAARLLQFSWGTTSGGEWKAARQGQFDAPPCHVNKAEANVGAMAFDCAVRDRESWGKWVAFGGDNTCASHGLHKGRSSKPNYNAVYRSVCAKSLLYNVQARWFWLPSKANPSDGPSRWWYDRKHKARADVYPGGAWIRDPASESGEALRPGPPRPMDVLAMHRRCENTAYDLMGEAALARSEGLAFPYKGVLPPADSALQGPSALGMAKLKWSSRRDYCHSFTGFSAFVRKYHWCEDSYAGVLAEFVHFCWSTGAAAKGTLNSLMSCMMYVCEDARATVARAQKALAGWQTYMPSKPWAPAPRAVVYLCALLLVRSASGCDVDAGLALVLGFHLYARGGELDASRCDDFTDVDDLRNVHAVPTVLLFDTKTGTRGIPQMITVDDPCMADLFRFTVQRARAREPDNPNPYLFSFPKGSLLGAFKDAQLALGFPQALWVRHSVRHGAATDDFVRKLRSLAEISLRLRHQNEKTSKGYLQDAAALALLKDLPAGVIDRIEAAGGAQGLLLQVVEKLDIIDTRGNWYIFLASSREN